MGAKSRRKGKSGELELVALARECGFPFARRGAPMQAGYGDDTLADVDGIPLLYAEAKRYRRTPVARLLAELLENERPGVTSALFWRDDDRPWRVALDAREYLNRHDELLRLRSEVLFLRSALAQVPAQTCEEDWPERAPVVAGQDPEAAGLSSSGTWRRAEGG